MFAPPLPEQLQTVLRPGARLGDGTDAACAADRIAWVAGLRQLVNAAEAAYLRIALGNGCER